MHFYYLCFYEIWRSVLGEGWGWEEKSTYVERGITLFLSMCWVRIPPPPGVSHSELQVTSLYTVNQYS